MKSTTKKSHAQLNIEPSFEEIIKTGEKAYKESAAITWRHAEVGRTFTQNNKIDLVDDKTLVLSS